MWIGIIIAIVVTILFFSWGRNRNTALQSTDKNYSSDGGSYNSYDDGGDSSDGGDGGSSSD
ncbi:hypothetical protein [Lacibacter sp. H407]|uniref:hypothetical protein n=1 Tax=Lacibacter sp. H407 TaxID=3133423 RepID=UPI0030C2A623